MIKAVLIFLYVTYFNFTRSQCKTCDQNLTAMPKNVAVITNYSCASAAELMVLRFKQSKKVSIFGENTAGVVDHLNFYPTVTPSGKFVFYIPDVMQTGKIKYDKTGIVPDVLLSGVKSDWIDFVMNYYAR